MENTLKYFQGRCKDLKMCLDTCRDKDGLEKAIAHNEKAVEALEKRVPKKYKKMQPCKSVNYYQCPLCDGLLHISENFCGECGQAIDWSEDEKD